MIKYLIKLQTNLNYPSTLYSKYILNQYLKCGDGYKNGTKHLFYSDDPTDHILIKEIFKRFKLPVVITNVKKESFEFESSNEILQIFLFRLCRYIRQASIKKILEDTIIINKAGVTIHNAFLLAHYNNMSCSYYNETMDIVKNFKTNFALHQTCKKLLDFKKKLEYKETPLFYNGLYSVVKEPIKRIPFILLIHEKKWKAAERFLLKLDNTVPSS